MTHPILNNLSAAKSLAKSLLSNNLIACCNIIPKIESLYMWEGKMQEDAEILMLIKTTSERKDDVIEMVLREHTYDTPEVIFTEITGGSEEYLKWVRGVVGGKDPKEL